MFNNMVGVAVTIVIYAMHEKPCIYLHDAWKFEKVPKFSHLRIVISQKTDQNFYLDMIDLTENYWSIND